MRPHRIFPLLLAPLALLAWAPASSAAVIEGTIEDPAGEPVGAVELELVPTDYRGRKEITTSGDDGRFHIEAVQAGAYKLRFRNKEVYSIEAEALAEDGTSAWQLAGVFEPSTLPPVELEEGQRLVAAVVLVDPGTEIERDPDGFRTRMQQAKELVQQGRCPDALPKLERHLEVFTQDASAYYLLGYCQASTGRAEQGVGSLERALDLDPRIQGAALLTGQILMQMQRPEDAAVWFRRETELENNQRLATDAWIALGFVERDGGSTEAAIEAFEQARALAPERPEPYTELARLYGESGDVDKLEQVLAAGDGKTSIEPLLNLGIARLREERFDEADSIFRSGLELASNDGERAMAWALIGRGQLRQENRTAGIESLKKSLKLDPDGRFATECRKILDQLGAG